MLKNYLKKILLVRVPKLVPNNLLIKYWILLSFSQGFVTNNHRIKSIRKFESKMSNDLHLIEATDGEILIQNISRISRFLRGKSHAANRLYAQYTNELLSLGAVEQSKNKVVFFDVGANIGEFSIAIAEKFSNFQIFAFEPDPVAFECLRYNIASLNLSNCVSIYNLALSDKSGFYPFYVSTKNADSSFIKPKSYTKIIKIQSSRAEDFMLANKIEFITMLKMDAEGFEPEIISGFGTQISSIKFLAIDVGPERDGQETALEIENALRAQGMSTTIYSLLGGRKFLNAFWK
jgi:FkbM family methyltransferase